MSVNHSFVSVLVSALLMILASPPFDFWPLAFVMLIPIYFGILNVNPLRAAVLTWFMGSIAIMGACLWWTPFLMQFSHLPFGISLASAVTICVYQGISFGLWGGICTFLHQRYTLSWLVTSAPVIVLAEHAVPFIFKFYLGVTVWRAWPLTQMAELGGAPAVSAIVVAGNIILAESIKTFYYKKSFCEYLRRGLVIFVLLLIASGFRAEYISRVQDNSTTIKIGLVQPNFGVLSVRDRTRKGQHYIQSLRDSTISLSERGAELILWPETSWPYLIDRDLKQDFPKGHPWEIRKGFQGNLLLGALTHSFGTNEVYNSALLFNATGQISGRYDKIALVPFTEYIPLREFFPNKANRLRKRLNDWPDIEQGANQKILKTGNLKIGALICSEDLDISHVQKVARHNPNILVSLVSDAWFGKSAAPKQHLALASFRAIETRRNLVRNTNTGVSSVVDALGRIKMEGPVTDPSRINPVLPNLMMDEVAIISAFSIGPYLIPLFPYLCLVYLVVVIKIQVNKNKFKEQ